MQTLAKIIADVDLLNFEERCAAAGFLTPQILWDPSPQEIKPQLLKILRQRWFEIGDGGGVARTARMRLSDLASCVDCLLVMDVFGGETTYRVYGAGILESAGIAPVSAATGKRAELFGAQFFRAGCEAVSQRKQPLLTRHQPPDDPDGDSWARLILPLVNDRGVVSRFLVGCSPTPCMSPCIMEEEQEIFAA